MNYDPFARYYDADFRDYHDDLALYRELARRTGGPLLELMCGTGRVLLPLAAEGHMLTGVDISPAMLQIAAARLQEFDLSAQVNLIEGDVRSLSLPERHFALAFVAVNSFMHLETVRDQLACLSNVRRALTRRGLLVLDLFSPDPHELLREDNRLVLDREYELDGNHVQKFIAIDSDVASQLSRITYIYDETAPSGMLTRRTMHFNLRWLYRFELEHLLARAGFSLRNLYGSYELDEYATGSPRLIAVAGLSR
ncbi:class I SAM-dependent methyltransferase [Candidatus Viridilinea mediisalina]|uniref:Methyltransferase type 12 n=1 Tax=Candidatus Viridilinea mediisalina TaxID=2024553 RepID=A0A2A6RIY0_9CHLR|nr:class I SAM-dependent methyltransferase [Candidatus Viridilinea mediisalina]PDW02903.1 methyltransferase type 12 [Candidatus Viridilinea mediisalina]